VLALFLAVVLMAIRVDARSTTAADPVFELEENWRRRRYLAVRILAVAEGFVLGTLGPARRGVGHPIACVPQAMRNRRAGG